MNCNCLKACSVPYCITELEIGVIEQGLTDLIVEFKDVVTGRVKKLTGIAPQSDGLLIVDVEEINAFFSPNFSYELKVLYSDESGCETVSVDVGGETVSCVQFTFSQGVSTYGIIVLEGQTSQYMYLTGNAANDLFFTPAFSGSDFIVYWADGSANVVNSGFLNSHTYAGPGSYTIKIRGDFSNMTSFSTGNTGRDLTNAVITSVNSITNLVLRSNNLTSAVVDNLLVNMDQNGLTSGLISLQNQSPVAPPTSLGNAAKTNLIGKGWNVTTD